VLETLEGRLGDLLVRWRQALRSALQSAPAQHSLQAMTPSERRPIEQFLARGDDDPIIPDGFVTAAAQALRGIEALALPADGLIEALQEGGLPCTVDELERRFRAYVHGAMRGHDPANTRLTLDR